MYYSTIEVVMSDYFTKIYRVETIMHQGSGKLWIERFYNSDGRQERAGGLPSEITYCEDTGLPRSYMWHRNGDLHRNDDLPAVLNLDPETGQHIRETYVVDGLPHRVGDKPAEIEWDWNGKVVLERYYYRGQVHRENGPAEITYDPDTGEILEETFVKYGREVPRPDIEPTPAP